MGTLCAQLLLQFYISQFETLQALSFVMVCRYAYGFGIIIDKNFFAFFFDLWT